MSNRSEVAAIGIVALILIVGVYLFAGAVIGTLIFFGWNLFAGATGFSTISWFGALGLGFLAIVLGSIFRR